MKKTVILCAAMAVAAAVATPALAQEEEPQQPQGGSWTTNTTPAMKLSEFMFNNWSKSGNSQIDLTATFFGNYKYTHPKFVWDNVVDLAYGYAWQDLDDSDTAGGLFETRRKSNDKIDLTSAISWNAYKGWGASFTANLKTQFGNGYEYNGFGAEAEATKKLVSSFMAPGYLTTALAFEYKKTDWSVSLSFITGKTTFVCSDDLIHDSLFYGVIQKDNFDYTNPSTYTHYHVAWGSYVKAQYLKKDLLPNFDLYARIELFYDYKKSSDMSWNDLAATKYQFAEGEDAALLASYNWLQRRVFETDMDFELKLDYRFSSHIAANFALNLKWDTDYSGMGRYGHLQLYQMAGVQVFFNWKTPGK